MLANNHVLDFSDEGLVVTFDALRGRAGHRWRRADLAEAERPSGSHPQARREAGFIIFAAGAIVQWHPVRMVRHLFRAGLALLPDLSPETAERDQVARCAPAATS